MALLGITSKCVGACGLMSLNARQYSSSNTIDAGISRSIIFWKTVVSAIVHLSNSLFGNQHDGTGIDPWMTPRTAHRLAVAPFLGQRLEDLRRLVSHDVIAL